MNPMDNLSMLLMMQQLAQAKSSQPRTNKGGKTEGQEFQDLLNQKHQKLEKESGQTSQTQDQAEKVPVDGKAPSDDEQSKLPGEEQMAMAALAAAQIVIVPEEETVPVQEEAPVEIAVQTVSEVPKVEGQPQTMEAPTEQQGGEKAPVDTTAKETVGTTEQQAAPVEKEQTLETRPADTRVQANRSAEQGTEQTATQTEADVTPETAEQPLFRDVESAPVKVGSAETLEKPAGDESVERQVVQQVEQAVERGVSRVTVTLQPESLGNVTVELTRGQDGVLHVLLNAESPKTQTLLEKGALNLQGLLMDSTQGTVQVQVERQQEGQQSQQHPYDQDSQGGQQQQQEQSRQRQPQRDVDFLQQLRLGLIPLDGAAS